MEIYTTKYRLTKEDHQLMMKYCKERGIKLQYFAGEAIREKIQRDINERDNK